MSKKLSMMLVFALCLSLVSCIEIKQNITVNRDGSGDAQLEFAILAQFASKLIPKMKTEVPSGWNIIDEKDKDGKHYIIFGRKFSDISELNDKNNEYIFKAEDRGFMSGRFSLEVIQKDSASPGLSPGMGEEGITTAPGENTSEVEPPAAPPPSPRKHEFGKQMPPLTFPFVITIKMPGSIYETNGTKISSSVAQWTFQGLKTGMTLVVKSEESIFSSPYLMYGGIGLACLIMIFGIVLILAKRKKKATPAPSKVSLTTSSRGPFCTQCGTQNDPGASFCINCGSRL